MSNPFKLGDSTSKSGNFEFQIGQYMQQAFKMGTNNFVNNLCRSNPQAMQIYNSMLQSGNPKQFYYDLMSKRGMTPEQAKQFASQFGIKL